VRAPPWRINHWSVVVVIVSKGVVSEPVSSFGADVIVPKGVVGVSVFICWWRAVIHCDASNLRAHFAASWSYCWTTCFIIIWC
jgi:hypothetical protein